MNTEKYLDFFRFKSFVEFKYHLFSNRSFCYTFIYEEKADQLGNYIEQIIELIKKEKLINVQMFTKWAKGLFGEKISADDQMRIRTAIRNVNHLLIKGSDRLI